MEEEDLPTIARTNLEGLHEYEEQFRVQCLSHILKDSKLTDHYTMAAISMDMVHILAITHDPLSEDELTLQKLGLRLFNNGATSVKLALTGYYQRALDIIRDNIELVFLLDYFLTNPQQISIWGKCTTQERLKHFSPIRIREALDERDGFKGKKRFETYSTFSEFASHATYKGFKLLVPEATKLHTIGPFFDPELLAISINEMARHQCYGAAVFVELFPNTSPEVTAGKNGFMLYATDWRIKHNAPLAYND